MNPGLTRPLKVGDKVWCKCFGYGQVEQVNQYVLFYHLYALTHQLNTTLNTYLYITQTQHTQILLLGLTTTTIFLWKLQII